MPIVTRRAQDNGRISIDHEACNLCGLCVKVCKGFPLYIADGEVKVDHSRGFGCIGCGQCTAVCPQHCIIMEGRTVSADDYIKLPSRQDLPSYQQLLDLMLHRRSIRNFQNKEVETESVEKILEAAAAAPMGLPPSEVEVLVLHGFKQVQEFAEDAVDMLMKNRWVFSAPAMLLWRLFTGKESADLMKSFAAPLPGFLDKKRKEGEDWLLYGAPLAMYFYSSPTSDPADPLIPATYAMLAAETLGLGTCMIGSIAPFLRYNSKVNTRYGIPSRSNHGVVVIFGYPSIRYNRAIRRTFAGVRWYGQGSQN